MDTTTKKKKHVSGVTVVSYVVLALLSLSAILPFVLMFTSSISSEAVSYTHLTLPTMR